MSRERQVLQLMANGRFVVGGGSVVAPRLVGRAFGIDVRRERATVYVARLFGARAVAMAAMTLVSEGEDLRRQLQFGLGVDLVDAAAAATAGARGQLRPRAAAAATAAALFQAGLGAWLLGRDQLR